MHEDDLAGRLLAQQAAGGDRWEVVELPAIDDRGLALWPEAYPIAALDSASDSTPNAGSRLSAALDYIAPATANLTPECADGSPARGLISERASPSLRPRRQRTLPCANLFFFGI